MPIVFDLIVIVIVALCTFIGYKQGLVKCVVNILSFFAAIIIALLLYRPVSAIIINKTSIDDNIKNAIIQQIESKESEEEMQIFTGDFGNMITGEVNNKIEEIANNLTVKIIEIVVLLLLFIITKIILKLIFILTDLITKLPVLKQIDKLGGTIYGVVKGIILVYTILAVIYLISPFIKKSVTEGINNSIITKIIYNNNLILNIII